MSFIGDIVGSLITADSNRHAANVAADGVAESNAIARDQYTQNREDRAPWMAAGQNALEKLTALLNDGSLTSRFAGNLDNEKGYQFARQEGQRAIDNSASARGGIGGAALKAGARFAEDNANRFYGDAFNRWNTENTNTFNRLAGVSGVGQQQNDANQSAGQFYAGTAGGNLMAGANARGQAAAANGNIYGNLATNALSGVDMRDVGDAWNLMANGFSAG